MVTFSIEPSLRKPDIQTVNIFLNGKHVGTIIPKGKRLQIVLSKIRDPEAAIEINRKPGCIPIISIKMVG